MAHEALRLELHEHRPHRRVARRVVEPPPDLLGGPAVPEREEDGHDLALAAAQFFVRWRHRVSLADVLRTQHTATFVACQVPARSPSTLFHEDTKGAKKHEVILATRSSCTS